MVENKGNFIPSIVYEDGTKYVANPFATEGFVARKVYLNSEVEISLCCDHCDLQFTDYAEYEHHIIEMHGKKQIAACHLCNATFRRQDHLKRHIKSLHNNQKSCVCPVCSKDFKRQDLLLKHIKRKHTAPTEVFHCRECDFQCSSLTELENHESLHFLTDRHVCPQCSTTFKRRDHMLRHVKSQHLKQMVLCPICGQSYKRKDHVVRHVREKHKMGLLNGKLITSSAMLE